VLQLTLFEPVVHLLAQPELALHQDLELYQPKWYLVWLQEPVCRARVPESFSQSPQAAVYQVLLAQRYLLALVPMLVLVYRVEQLMRFQEVLVSSVLVRGHQPLLEPELLAALERRQVSLAQRRLRLFVVRHDCLE
jgi:hypothetical protein